MNNDKCEFCKGTGKEPGEPGCVWCHNTGTKEGQSLLTPPAQQYQGEPVALPARRVSEGLRVYGQGESAGWNACLDEIAKLGPVYTHADPAEVERLRETLELVREQRDNELRTNSSLERERDTLRAQLAKAQALIPGLNQDQKDALYSFYLSICGGDLHSVDKHLIRQLCEIGALESVGFGKHRLTKFGEYLLNRMSAAALSTSAELSAPVEIDERGSGSLEFDKLLAEYHAILWASGEDGEVDYDLAGIGTAKKLQALHRAALERKP